VALGNEETTIRRHVNIRADANPSDPLWRKYFEDRVSFKKLGNRRSGAGIGLLS
jgi:hypothetical protein